MDWRLVLAEFVGTALLILLGTGVNAANSLNKAHAKGTGWVLIAFGWAFAVMVGASVSIGIHPSGGSLNPAGTIAGLVSGGLDAAQAIGNIVAQLLGAMLGALLTAIFYYSQFDATEDAGTKLGVFATGPAVPNTGLNLFSEAIGTFVLVFATSGAVASTMGGDIFVPFLIASIGMSLGSTTGYAINPARDLGPRIVHALFPFKNKGDSNWGYAWIPVVGPIVGAVVAALLAGLL